MWVSCEGSKGFILIFFLQVMGLLPRYTAFTSPSFQSLECSVSALWCFFQILGWKHASSPDTSVEQASSSDRTGSYAQSSCTLSVSVRNLSHLFSQVLLATCREYSKAKSGVSLGLTVVRKSFIQAALLLSVYCPALKQMLWRAML